MQKKRMVAAGIILSFCFTETTKAQTMPGYEISAGASTFIYQGDLSPSKWGSYRTVRPGITLTGSKLLNQFWSVRMGMAVGALRGNDSKFKTPAYRQERNFRFSSLVSELSAVAVYNFRGTNGDNDWKVISPYAFGGIGFSFLRTRRDDADFNVAYFGAESWVVEGLAADRSRNPVSRLLVFPVGLGLRYPLTSQLSLSLETSYRISFTDYLDGFSKSAGSQYKDYYYSHTASIIYHFGGGKRIACPVIRP